MMNPPKKLTMPEKIERRFSRHADLVIFVLGILVGFILSRL